MDDDKNIPSATALSSKDNTARVNLSDRMIEQNAEAWLSLRDDLMPGVNAPKSAFIAVTAAGVINRNKQV